MSRAHSISIKCPGCKKTLNAPSAMAGKPVKCPGCGQKFRVPGPVTAKVTSTGAQTPCQENFLATCKYFSRRTDDADITTSRCSLKTLRYLDDSHGQHTGGDQNFCLGCAVYEIKSQPPPSPARAHSPAPDSPSEVFAVASLFVIGAVMFVASARGLWMVFNIYDPYHDRSLTWKWIGVLFFSFWILFGLLACVAMLIGCVKILIGSPMAKSKDANPLSLSDVGALSLFVAFIVGITWLVGLADNLRPYKNLIESESRFAAISGLKSAAEDSQRRIVIKGKVYVIDKDEARLDFAMQMRLPEHLRATTPEEVQTVVWLDYELRRVGNYGTTHSYGTYGNGPRIPGDNSGTSEITAYAHDCKVTVIDLPSKTVLVDAQLIPGEDPPAVKSVHTSATGEKPTEKILSLLGEFSPRKE